MEEKKGFSFLNLSLILTYISCLSAMYIGLSMVFAGSGEKEDETKMDTNIIWGLVSTVAASAITAATTISVSRRSQIRKLTDQIENLNKSVGIDLGKEVNLTLQHKDIKATMQEQHKDIRTDFQIIQDRYRKEDNAYQVFTAKQRDMKESLDGFSREFTSIIQQSHILESETAELQRRLTEAEQEKEIMKEELGIQHGRQIAELQARIAALKRENDGLREQLSRAQGSDDHMRI